MKIFERVFIVIIILIAWSQLTISCAQRGRPTGGPKDTIPPKFINSTPPNYTTNFKHKSIRINFDEYVLLDKPSEQIMISPPISPKPTISPQGLPAKYVEIEFSDSLQPNTTYTINFGNSIVDNNENNPVSFFKYVFSTGKAIDSLSLTGHIMDAFDRETESAVSVMLYRLDSTYSDSIIYKKPPTYITYTKGETNRFELENLKEGNYKIVAIKDENQNYLFNPKKEKIGFLTDTIHLPSEREYDLKIFKEIGKFSPENPKQISRQHLLFGYKGKADSLQINLLSEVPNTYKSEYYQQKEHDSIDYWFKPRVDVDTLKFETVKAQQRDTVMVLLDKEAEADSLKFTPDPSSDLRLGKSFRLSANTPLHSIDDSQITILDKDSASIKFSTQYEAIGNTYLFNFKTEENQVYHLQILPNAFTDFYGKTNDTLAYNLRTKSEMDYGDLTVTIENIDRFPVIVQITDENGKMKEEIIHHKKDGNVFAFHHIMPYKYYIRLIYDDNDNGIWDTGNYLKKDQPEEVIYMEEPLDVRKNWDVSQTFILKLKQ